QPEERGHPSGRGRDDDGAGLRTRACRGADETHHLEHTERLTDAGAPDTELAREVTLRREPVPRAQTSVEEVALDVFEYELPGARRLFTHRSSCGLTTAYPPVVR